MNPYSETQVAAAKAFTAAVQALPAPFGDAKLADIIPHMQACTDAARACLDAGLITPDDVDAAVNQ